jgi:uncharacterized damage-inducible protein DinB
MISNIQEMGVAPFYEGWQRANTRLIERIGELNAEALGFRAAEDSWPIWAMVGHLAGARVYWLCGALKEPGAEATPFPDALGEGWEDRLDVPRRAEELVTAIDTSWRIVESCLEQWTPAMLSQKFRREINGTVQMHTRQSVVMRLSPMMPITVARFR